MLIIAASAVLLLLVAMLFNSSVPGDAAAVRNPLSGAIIIAAGTVAGLMLWFMAAKATRNARQARAETVQLRKKLASADAILRAEPQVLIFWEQAEAVRVAVHTLTSIPSLPNEDRDILRFGNWLEHSSAESLKSGLDRLFRDGRAFNAILKTLASGRIEAEGRAVGGRAILRFKDVSGFKAELAHLLDQTSDLARDVQTSRKLLDAIPMPAWLRASDGRLNWVNTAYVTAVEAASEQEVLERQIELLESRHRKRAEQHLSHGESFKDRAHLVVNGVRKPHEIIALPAGRASAGVAIDITAIEDAEVKLEQQISAYDRTLHRVETAVAIFDSEHQLVFFNEAFEILWRLDPNWLGTRPTIGTILDTLRDQRKLPPAVNYREWKNSVLSYRDGAETYDEPWHLSDGRILRVIGERRQDGGITYLFADQTERVALESRYNALIDVQRETLDSLAEGVAVFGTNGRLKLHNLAFATIWQLNAELLQNRPHIDEVRQEAESRYGEPEVWALIKRTITAFDDQREPYDGQLLRSDKAVIDYALMPLPDGDTLLTCADVTDARRAERALQERNEALVAADRLKTQFIGNVSYELRTPLNSIIGFAEMMGSSIFGELNDKQREYITDIISSSKTLLAIIDDILDLTTIEAGILEISPEPIGIRSLLDAAILGIRERAIRSRLTIDIAVADDVSEIYVDEARMRQVLYNLLSNAVGFSKQNGVIELTCWQEAGIVIFEIKDHGVGIPKEQLDAVFQLFESHSQGGKHRGAGLGLSIAKSLIELHGGTILIESEKDKGTTVTIRLPQNRYSSAAGTEQGNQPSIQGAQRQLAHKRSAR